MKKNEIFILMLTVLSLTIPMNGFVFTSSYNGKSFSIANESSKATISAARTTSANEYFAYWDQAFRQ